MSPRDSTNDIWIRSLLPHASPQVGVELDLEADILCRIVVLGLGLGLALATVRVMASGSLAPQFFGDF
jgi:hypothetical protein